MLRICQVCDGLHERGERCPEASRRRDRQRPSREQRGYDTAWRRLAKRVIDEEGSCRTCGHTGSPDNTLTADHIVPLKAGGARLDRANVQCLCRRHNSAKGGR